MHNKKLISFKSQKLKNLIQPNNNIRTFANTVIFILKTTANELLN